MPKILLFANTDWYLYNFRLALIKELRERGSEVVLLSPPGDFHQRLKEQGLTWLPFPLARQGINPFNEIVTLLHLIRVYQQVRPEIVHHFTIKPVIYGSLAAQLLHIPGINSITGLGHIFIDSSFLTRIVLRRLTIWLYRLSLRNTQVIFENPEDHEIFINNKLIKREQSHLIFGTGVDVEKFQPVGKTNDVPLILFASRLLATKGLIEYIDAIRILKQKGLKARFAVAGTPDPGNPASVTDGQLHAWKKEDLVEWWGWQDNMPAVLAKTDIFCLPSYREGVPNALLEACASGLPIVTTDVPGCRDVVQHGANGLLVPPRNTQALAAALETLIIDTFLRSRMGKAGRQIALERFSLAHIIEQNLSVYDQVFKNVRRENVS